MVHAIASSGRVLDVLVGPAGAGKTTTLAALRTAWEDGHGAGSVIGLAPSAAAAQVLADELGIVTDNTAKWLHEARRQDRTPRRHDRPDQPHPDRDQQPQHRARAAPSTANSVKSRPSTNAG